MRIKALNLISYGKFENKELRFKEGLNIIYGRNGSGKSTVSTALKAFLYKDLKGGGKYKKTYIPLGEKHGAYDVLFETDDGCEYEAVITAGQTAAKTVYKTVELAKGREVSSGSDIGEYFFNTAEDMYDSVCFIREPQDFEKVSKNDKTVNEKLSQSAYEESSSADIKEAIESLTKEKLSYIRQTSSGLIFPKEEELSEINESISGIERISYEESRLKQSEEELIRKISYAREEKEKLSALAEKHRKYEEYQKYLKAVKGRDKAEELKRESEALNTEKCELSENEISKIKEADSFKEEKSPLVMLLLGAALIFVFLSILFPVCMILTAVLLVLSLIFSYLHKKKASGLREEALNKKYELLFSVGCKSLEEYYDKNNLYKQSLIKKEALEREIESILSLTSAPEEAEYAEKPEGDLSVIKNELARLSEEIASSELRLASVTERRKSLYNNLPSYEELKERKEELEDEIEKLKYEQRVTDKALQVLEITREKYKTSYLPALSKRAEEIFIEAEGCTADKLILDESFSPSLREEGSVHLKEGEHLSSGTSDGVYFAVRLAVAEAAFKDREKPVLILDDPFIRMDDERAELWIKYLLKRNDLQIIYLTAGKRIFNLGLENNAIFVL